MLDKWYVYRLFNVLKVIYHFPHLSSITCQTPLRISEWTILIPPENNMQHSFSSLARHELDSKLLQIHLTANIFVENLTNNISLIIP